MSANDRNFVAVVTGGSRGIGRAIAVEAARRGYDIVFTHRGRMADVEETKAQLGQHGVRSLDVEAAMEDEESLVALAQAAREFGPVQLLFNSAGFGQDMTLSEMTDEYWWASMDTHVTASLILSRELHPELAANQGSIVNVSSDGGVVGSVHSVAYGASKAGQIGLGLSLAREFAPDVRVNNLAPGPVATELWAEIPEEQRQQIEGQTPMRRVGSPEGIARSALDLAEWTYVTGQTVVVNGGRTMQ